ncbi:MAG TPA: lysylphosphatidylglycerol synthase transmembrane domain-containing protein [Thermodesulfovibrionales bacterium]|nr:lysylphosphatidylglycerol synthase transmembrane domain-containing protein [Thermodesulfovibrionales bacterium]
MAPQTDIPGEQRPLKAKKILLVALKLVVSGGLLYAIISKTGIQKLTTTLQGINAFYFLIASLIYISSVFLSSLRWRLLLSEDFAIGKLFSLYMIGSFFNNILPGIVGGDAIKAYYLYRSTGKSGPAVASVFLDRYVGFSALLALGLIAYPFGFRYFRGSYIEWTLPFIVALFIIASFLTIGLRLGGRIGLLGELYNYFSLYKSKGRVVIQTFSISLVIQVLNVFAVFLVSSGLAVAVPLLSLFIFVPIIATLATLPVSISGLGVREASFVLLLGFLGIPPIQATAVSLAWFLSVALGSLPGLVMYLLYRPAGAR